MERNNEEILAIFLEEARDLLVAFATSLNAWSRDFDNKNYLLDLKRDLHTLKGGARMVGKPEFSAVAHELESLCDAVWHSPVQADKETYELMCLGQDQMDKMLGLIEKKEEIKSATDLILQFQQKTTTLSKMSKHQVLDTDEIHKSKMISTGPIEQVLRVRADLLEKLNNLSIENNINRVNMEHAIANLVINLIEINKLAKVVQEKLRIMPKEIDLLVSAEVMAVIDRCKDLLQTTSNAELLLVQQSRIALELQEGLIETRMVPFNSTIPRLSRMVRQVANELKKSVYFNILATNGEIDRNLLEHLIPALEHLLRNAIDHGIESPNIRLHAGKPEAGKIELRFFRLGNNVNIEIKDDGSGINVKRVREIAIEKKLLMKDKEVSDEEIIRIILEPGFSTQIGITEISGRGIGMDVVNTVVKGLGGNLSIRTIPQKGTEFIIRLPFTTSMNRALLVVIHHQQYGILLSNVKTMILLSRQVLKEHFSKPASTFKYAEKEYQLKYLNAVLGLQEKPIFSNLKENLPVLLLEFPEFQVALLVDELAGSQEVVVQTLGPQFKLMDTFSGATLLADGKVIIILDIFAIMVTESKQMLDDTNREKKHD